MAGYYFKSFPILHSIISLLPHLGIIYLGKPFCFPNVKVDFRTETPSTAYQKQLFC